MMLDSIITGDIPSEGVACEDEVLEVVHFLTPFFDVVDKIVDGILGTEFEAEVIVWPAASSHANNVYKVNLKHGGEIFHHLIEEST